MSAFIQTRGRFNAGFQHDEDHCETREDPRSLMNCAETVTLTWNDVNVYVKPPSRFCCRRRNTNREQKHIIRNVCGIAKPGTLVGIVGASGTGKTTLLNALCAGIDSESFAVSSDIRVNGLDVGLGIKNISGYIRQEEVLMPRMTVKEHLTFRALLRMDETLSHDRRLQRVKEVMSELNLVHCADTFVGIPGQSGGVSGGERRRMMFATEILTNPPLLFCDEPTSGLDSYMASNIMNILSDLASRGKTILCTIHQPSSDVFALFENIILLAQGRLAFSGRREDALQFFNRFGHVCPIHYNPADHYISVLAVEQGKEEMCKMEIEAICEGFESSDYMRACKEDITMATNAAEHSGVMYEEAFSSSSRYEAPWHQQFAAVMLRAFRTVKRDPLYTKSRIIQMISMGTILGLIYFQLDLSQQGVLDISGGIFIITGSLCFSNMNAAINVFIAEKDVFYREYATGLYRVDVYFLCKNLAEMPVYIIGPTLYACISYFLIGLNASGSAFFTFWLALVLLVNVSVSYGYAFSALVDTVNVVLVLTPLTLIIMALFGGFLLNPESMPVYVSWIRYISFFNYATEVLLTNQWRDIELIECPLAVTNSTDQCDQCYFTDGDSVLQYFNINKDNFAIDILVLMIMFVFYRCAALVILWVRARQYKDKHNSLTSENKSDVLGSV